MAQNDMYFCETNAGLCTIFTHIKLGLFSAVHIFWLHNNIRNFQLSIDPCIYNAKHEETNNIRTGIPLDCHGQFETT